MRKGIIYALLDPRQGRVRYVGQSIRGICRAHQHANPSTLYVESNLHKKHWILTLVRRGLKPQPLVLEAGIAETDLDTRELFWINHFKKSGASLTNLATGGSGTRGYTWTSIGRKNQSVAQRRRFKNRSVAEAEKHRNTMRAIWSRPSFIEKMKRVRRNQFTAVVRIKIAKTLGGRPIQDQYGSVYATIAEAVRTLGVRRSSVQLVLRGKYRHTAGYVFHYVPTTA